MRPIKFRAWQEDAQNDNEADLRFWSWEEMQQSNWQDMINNSKYKIMQYTGLKDKNGIEIYEGDILRLLNSDVLCEVTYNPPSFCRKWLNPKVSSLRGVELESMAHNTHIAYEIIGNIYENSELLEG